jgi:hypothetical protein
MGDGIQADLETFYVICVEDVLIVWQRVKKSLVIEVVAARREVFNFILSICIG